MWPDPTNGNETIVMISLSLSCLSLIVHSEAVSGATGREKTILDMVRCTLTLKWYNLSVSKPSPSLYLKFVVDCLHLYYT